MRILLPKPNDDIFDLRTRRLNIKNDVIAYANNDNIGGMESERKMTKRGRRKNTERKSRKEWKTLHFFTFIQKGNFPFG